MATTTTEYPLDFSTTTDLPELTTTLLTDLAASYIEASAPVHDQHNQITFEIPSHRDLEHIDTLHSFNTLLQRIAGNVATASHPSPPLGMDVGATASGHHITSEQISQSAVLNLADLKDTAASGLERFFAGADMQSVINYLWIGLVTSLVILSVIFIVFSCYFYRKFREWKKCNKNIRSHLNNDMYPGGTLVPCGEHNIVPTEAAYYQMESPPCYTIATGLPTYDEALHHQHFAFGMKFVYPTIAAVHHHAAISGWEKDELTLKRKDRQQQQQQQQQKKQKSHKVATLEAAAATPTCVVDAASVALLSSSSRPSQEEAPNEKSEVVSICMADDAEEEQLTQRATDTAAGDNDAFVVIVA